MTAEGALGAEGATAQAPGTEWAMGGLARGWGSPLHAHITVTIMGRG